CWEKSAELFFVIGKKVLLHKNVWHLKRDLIFSCFKKFNRAEPVLKCYRRTFAHVLSLHVLKKLCPHIGHTGRHTSSSYIFIWLVTLTSQFASSQVLLFVSQVFKMYVVVNKQDT